MIREEIRSELFRLQDNKYLNFQAKLLPTVKEETIIGVRTPQLRKYARRLISSPDISDFLDDIPHMYFDENQLHAFIVSEIREYGRCMEEVNRFLPYIDNWATCDQMAPRVYKKHRMELLENILLWIRSDKTYTIRFGIRMLMHHFLDNSFDAAYPAMVAGIKSKEYYVNMMIAWYFATALAKQYDEVLPYIENRVLDTWTHNKAIQKSVESYRIPADHKNYLKSLK